MCTHLFFRRVFQNDKLRMLGKCLEAFIPLKLIQNGGITRSANFVCETLQVVKSIPNLCIYSFKFFLKQCGKKYSTWEEGSTRYLSRYCSFHKIWSGCFANWNWFNKREMKLSYPFGPLVVAQIWSYDTTIEYWKQIFDIMM